MGIWSDCGAGNARAIREVFEFGKSRREPPWTVPWGNSPHGRLPIVVCDPPIVTTPKAASLRAYLELVEQYCEVLTSPPLEDTHKGDEMQLPSFDQFLDERGYSELAQLVREVFALRSGERSSEPLVSRNTEVVRERTP